MGDVIVELRIAGSRTEDVAVPCTHGPSCCEVGIQRNGIGLVLDRLEIIQELLRSSRHLRDAGLFPYSLIVGNAVCVSAVGDAVYLAVKGFVGCKIVDRIQRTKIAHGNEILTQVRLGAAGRNEADIAPVAGRKAKRHRLLIVGHCLVGHGDVGIQLMEALCILCIGGIHDIGAVGEDLDVCLDILIIGAQIDGIDTGYSAGSALALCLGAPCSSARICR